jgi:hypothetical protein
MNILTPKQKTCTPFLCAIKNCGLILLLACLSIGGCTMWALHENRNIRAGDYRWTDHGNNVSSLLYRGKPLIFKNKISLTWSYPSIVGVVLDSQEGNYDFLVDIPA